MQATAFIRGVPSSASITQVNVRSAPGVNGSIIFRSPIGVQAIPDAIKPDSGGDNYQGQVYKWFHLTFTDGRQGWVRNDLLDIQGDYTAFGYQNFASRVFAFAVDVPAQPTQPPVLQPPVTPPPITTPPVTIPPVSTPPVTPPPVTPPATTPPGIGGAPCAGSVRRDIQAKIRSAPTIRSSQVGYLNANQAVQIVGSADGQDGDGFRWAQVNALGMTGYIREDLLVYTGDCSFFNLDGTSAQSPTAPPPPPPNTPLNPQDKFAAPFRDTYTIFQEFGDTRYGSPHKGIDLDHTVGGALYASGNGIVAFTMLCSRCTDSAPNFQSQGIAFWDPSAVNDPAWGYGFGNHVCIRYAWPDLPVSMRNALAAQNLSNAFAYVIHGHMERVNILKGAAVQNGTPIGLSGNTGNSNGPHLHLEVRVSLSPNETNIYNRLVLNPRVMYSL